MMFIAILVHIKNIFTSSDLFVRALSGPAMGNNNDRFIYNKMPGLGAYGAYGMAF